MVFLKQTVNTPYGRGYVKQINASHVIVEPLDWLLANNQKPIFYMNPKDVKPFYNIGDKVTCSFGRGSVNSIRDEDGIYVITLNNWALADGKSPTLYLNEQSFQKDIESTIETKPAKPEITFESVYKQALSLKDQGKDLYMLKKYAEARVKYLEGLEIMRTVERELTDDEKGKFVDMSITSHSNLALCSFAISEYADCIRYGESTVHLIDAIERQGDDNIVWVALKKSGYTMEKLREQKVKAWRIIAKAEIKRQNFEEAERILKSSIAICVNDKTAKELNDMLVDVTKKLDQVKKKEKSMWQKAFKKGSDESIASDVPSPAVSPKRQNSSSESSLKAPSSSAAKIEQPLDIVDAEMKKLKEKYNSANPSSKKPSKPESNGNDGVKKPEDQVTKFITYSVVGIAVGAVIIFAFSFFKRR